MQRSKPIDILRALAVLLVIGAHMTVCPPQASPLLHFITAVWQCGGWIGVDLFFVLSGFLVAGLMFREHQQFGGISGKQFLIRRSFKIYPGFWLLIAATAVLGLPGHGPAHPHTIISELLFIQNYRSALLPHTWSLAVEEHFYLLLLILLLWLSSGRFSRNPFRAVPWVFSRFGGVLSHPPNQSTSHVVTTSQEFAKVHIFPTHLRMDSLFFGVMISYFYHYHREQFLQVVNRNRALLFVVNTCWL